MNDNTDRFEPYSDDKLFEGRELNIKRGVFLMEPDISDLISLSVGELQNMRAESVKAERAAFAEVQQAAGKWEKQALITHDINSALLYLRVPEVKHTSNCWEPNRSGEGKQISNRVYIMEYSFYENKSIPNNKNRCYVHWSLYTNSPDNYSGIKIAGQDKSYPDRASAEKYMQGRIKAYAHLFKEISPPIPQEYADAFRICGQLLPGYTIEGEQPRKSEKPSIRQELKTLRAASQNRTEPKPTKKRDTPEIGSHEQNEVNRQ